MVARSLVVGGRWRRGFWFVLVCRCCSSRCVEKMRWILLRGIGFCLRGLLYSQTNPSGLIGLLIWSDSEFVIVRRAYLVGYVIADHRPFTSAGSHSMQPLS